MYRWINIVETDCVDSSREEEFNDWYDNIHLPDVFQSPGFISATRCVIAEQREGRGKYLTIYEIETDDIDKTMALRRSRREEEKQRGRYTDLARPVGEMQYRVLGQWKATDK